MKGMRSIDANAFKDQLGPLPERDLGAAPMLKWIEIENLVIDPDYQRDLQRRGQQNIIKIALEFDWSKFSTVIVAAIEGGQFAIVDGQHRTTAAALRGIKKVPCQIITADRKKQAAAFAAINAVVTAMSSLQIHAAKVIAGDKNAVRIARVCADANVTICRYPVPADKMKPGETLAATSIYRSLERFGPETLTTALKCITMTGDGHPGLVRQHIISAYCIVLDAEPAWRRNEAQTLAALQSLDLRGLFRRVRMSEGNILTQIVVGITEHLTRQMKRAA